MIQPSDVTSKQNPPDVMYGTRYGMKSGPTTLGTIVYVDGPYNDVRKGEYWSTVPTASFTLELVHTYPSSVPNADFSGFTRFERNSFCVPPALPSSFAYNRLVRLNGAAVGFASLSTAKLEFFVTTGGLVRSLSKAWWLTNQLEFVAQSGSATATQLAEHRWCHQARVT